MFFSKRAFKQKGRCLDTPWIRHWVLLRLASFHSLVYIGVIFVLFTRCENCVELLFIRGSANCPECGIVLRRNNFRLQLFEDAAVEKEVDIRRKVLRE